MAELKIIVRLVPDDPNLAETSWEVPPQVAMRVLPLIFDCAVGQGPQSPPLPRTTMEYVSEAFSSTGRESMSVPELVREMQRLGWKTRSTKPANVLGVTLRESSRYQRAERGRWSPVQP
jgi:hypothetical protein